MLAKIWVFLCEKESRWPEWSKISSISVMVKLLMGFVVYDVYGHPTIINRIPQLYNTLLMVVWPSGHPPSIDNPTFDLQSWLDAWDCTASEVSTPPRGTGCFKSRSMQENSSVTGIWSTIAPLELVGIYQLFGLLLGYDHINVFLIIQPLILRGKWAPWLPI